MEYLNRVNFHAKFEPDGNYILHGTGQYDIFEQFRSYDRYRQYLPQTPPIMSIAFIALMTVYRKCEIGIEDRQQLETQLDELQMLCPYPYALNCILAICKQLAYCCGRRYHPLVTQCINMISQKYATPISQQEIADALNISNVYLSSLFRKETGQKFSAYVNDYRLGKAKKLIDKGEYPLSQIYEMVGFSNQQYFSNCFRRKYEMSPSEYRNRTRKNA